MAIAPPRAELWLLAALTDGELDGLDGCLASGMLRAERDAVRFRHEIARVAVEEALAPAPARGAAPQGARGARGGCAARTPRVSPTTPRPPTTRDAVLRYAPAAGERAAMLGAHREAAAQFARALRHGAGLPPDRRAELLERRSYECYLTDEIPERASKPGSERWTSTGAAGDPVARATRTAGSRA